MPANHIIDDQNQLLITIWEGEAHDIEFIEAIQKYQKEIQNHPNYAKYNEVVDLRKITKLKLSTEGIKLIGTIASTTDIKEINKKLALIVSSNLAFGLARMYEAYRSFSKYSNKEIRVFKDESEAFVWAKNNILQKN